MKNLIYYLESKKIDAEKLYYILKQHQHSYNIAVPKCETCNENILEGDIFYSTERYIDDFESGNHNSLVCEECYDKLDEIEQYGLHSHTVEGNLSPSCVVCSNIVDEDGLFYSTAIEDDLECGSHNHLMCDECYSKLEKLVDE